MTENGKVTIVADDNGSVIRVSKNNPEFGHVRLTQEKVGFGSQGWVKRSTRSTLIHGTVEDLEATGLASKKELAGQIVIREQFEPFNEKNPDRDLKIAGDTGIVLIGTNPETGEMDAPIYRKTFYSMDSDEQDTLVTHTNSNAIREANGLEPKKATISKDELDKVTSETTRRNKKSEEIVETSSEEIEVEEDVSFELS
tara:strand:+ start:2744 stop:3337 length:594 start_codon:yes stop_codon:yes gene_type:complete